MTAIDISLTHLMSFAVAVVVSFQTNPEQVHEDARQKLLKRLRDRGLLSMTEGDPPEDVGIDGLGRF